MTSLLREEDLPKTVSLPLKKYDTPSARGVAQTSPKDVVGSALAGSAPAGHDGRQGAALGRRRGPVLRTALLLASLLVLAGERAATGIREGPPSARFQE